MRRSASSWRRGGADPLLPPRRAGTDPHGKRRTGVGNFRHPRAPFGYRTLQALRHLPGCAMRAHLTSRRNVMRELNPSELREVQGGVRALAAVGAALAWAHANRGSLRTLWTAASAEPRGPGPPAADPGLGWVGGGRRGRGRRQGIGADRPRPDLCRVPCREGYLWTARGDLWRGLPLPSPAALK